MRTALSALSIIFTVLEQTVNGALQGLGKIYIPAIALTIGVAIKFLLNLTLVPIQTIGAAGAAFATVVCHAVAFAIGFYVLKKRAIMLSFNNLVKRPSLGTLLIVQVYRIIHL